MWDVDVWTGNMHIICESVTSIPDFDNYLSNTLLLKDELQYEFLEIEKSYKNISVSID